MNKLERKQIITDLLVDQVDRDILQTDHCFKNFNDKIIELGEVSESLYRAIELTKITIKISLFLLPFLVLFAMVQL